MYINTVYTKYLDYHNLNVSVASIQIIKIYHSKMSFNLNFDIFV